MPVKPLSFKGEKKIKKRKRQEDVSADLDGRNSQTVDPAEDDSWATPLEVGELTGPLVIVLPTTPATCIAADAHGNVFASALENMVEKDPKTAEPHNVQQVWVVTKVAGLGEGEISLKGSHGGFLSCDSLGTLGAKREARGREESFVVEVSTDEGGKAVWRLRTAASRSTSKPDDFRYLSASIDNDVNNKDEDEDSSSKLRKKVSISLRGDAEATSSDTHMILRMQSRYRPRTNDGPQATKSREKISRRELKAAAGRMLTDEEAKRLKRAKRDGTYHEEILDLRAKGKHDKFA